MSEKKKPRLLLAFLLGLIVTGASSLLVLLLGQLVDYRG
jgi:hypothetical protein